MAAQKMGSLMAYGAAASFILSFLLSLLSSGMTPPTPVG